LFRARALKPCFRGSFYVHLWWENLDGVGENHECGGGKTGTIHMVGDNPASNIQDANSFTSRHGTEWKSILVESGLHVAGEEPVHNPLPS
jgi:ribonucleotide monophosphatase NagD (HAD superfamily)